MELAGQLTKQFGKTEIIRGVDLQVAAGERVAIIGPNGAGKSTLFNLISGRFAPTSQAASASRGSASTVCKPFEINRHGLVTQLPNYQHLPQTQRV
jgi:branched-chain amino acid transport system ATP-binding protein